MGKDSDDNPPIEDDFTLRRQELSPPEGQTRLAEVRLTAIYPDGKRKSFTVWYGHPVQIDERSGGPTYAVAACWGLDDPPRYLLGGGAMQAIHMASYMINSMLKHMLNQGIRIRYPRSPTNLGYRDIDCFSTPRLHHRWHGPYFGHNLKAKSMKRKPAIPNPDTLQPLTAYPYLIFLRNAITNPRIHVGEYTYYDDTYRPGDFESRNVLYHYDFIGDHLHIGRFCCIARDVRFIMNGANHSMAGFSTYPFYIFGGAWADMVPPDENQTSRGDTVVGSDVWIGYGATILPGVKIGHGAIIGACSVVTRDVEPYTIVGGNPAQPIRKRHDDATIARLLELAWWDWPAAKFTPHLPALIRGDREWLSQLAEQSSV